MIRTVVLASALAVAAPISSWAQGVVSERPASSLQLAVGPTSLGASLRCSVCGDTEVDRRGGWGVALGVTRPLNTRLALQFDGNVARVRSEYVGTVTLGLRYLALPSAGVFVHGGLGAYHTSSGNDCLTIAESGSSGDCEGWDSEAAAAVSLGIGMNVPTQGSLTPVVRLVWQRSLMNGFGSRNFPLDYNQVALFVGASVGL